MSYVIYNSNASKNLELVKWILDPYSRPEFIPKQKQAKEERFEARSASLESKCTVQKQLDLQKMILGNY